MNRRVKIRLIFMNMILVVLLFGLVTLNKEYLRPSFGHIGLLGLLTGIFPNFIAAFLIGMACVNAVLTREPRYGRLIVYVGFMLVFAILAVEEIRPMWGANTHYDTFDILASGVGSVLAILVFEMMVQNRKKKRHA